MPSQLQLDDASRRRLTMTGRPDGSAVATVAGLHTWTRNIVLTAEQVRELRDWCAEHAKEK